MTEVYDSLETLGMLQVDQLSFVETVIYVDVLIGQIRQTVSYP